MHRPYSYVGSTERRGQWQSSYTVRNQYILKEKQDWLNVFKVDTLSLDERPSNALPSPIHVDSCAMFETTNGLASRC